jgi:hypothetical protein
MSALRKDQKLLVALATSIAVSVWIIIFEVITGLWRTWIYSFTLNMLLFANLFLFLFYLYLHPRFLLYNSKMTLRKANLAIMTLLIVFAISMFFRWLMASYLGLPFPEIISDSGLVLFFLWILTSFVLIRIDIKKKTGPGTSGVGI